MRVEEEHPSNRFYTVEIEAADLVNLTKELRSIQQIFNHHSTLADNYPHVIALMEGLGVVL